MIHWLVQSTQDHPALEQALAPEGLLSVREQEQFSAFRNIKRRREWLMGRWTSKMLVQALVRGETGEDPPLSDLVVSNDPDGAPNIACDLRYNQLSISLSISHSGSHAFCAAMGLVSVDTHNSFGIIGADIEQVEARSPGFVQDYFTETEIALLNRARAPSRDLLVTATWSAKESALKALHLGLTVDTRSATCLIEAIPHEAGAWAPFQVEWDVRRLNRAEAHWPEPPRLIGWWRIMDGYVLTLAAPSGQLPQENSILQEVFDG